MVLFDRFCHKNSAFGYFSLRSFALTWTIISVLAATITLAIGIACLQYEWALEAMIADVAEWEQQQGIPHVAGPFETGVELFSGVLNVMTWGRGITDLISIILFMIGIKYKKWLLVNIHLGMTLFNAVFDFAVFLALNIALGVLYVYYFYPSWSLIVFFGFGWQIFVLPYVYACLASYRNVILAGGDGRAHLTDREVAKETGKLLDDEESTAYGGTDEEPKVEAAVDDYDEGSATDTKVGDSAAASPTSPDPALGKKPSSGAASIPA